MSLKEDIVQESPTGEKTAAKFLSPEQCFAELKSKLEYLSADQMAVANIRKAFEFALKKHEGQFRKSGEPYINHPVAVAQILTELKIDEASLISAILHDVVEDTDTSLEEIAKNFGPAVADLVDGLTKIGKIKFRSTEERLAENFRKMVLAMAKDLRVILIKLADRLHNMRTLGSLHEAKRQRIAQETLDIYAPLASRLGIYSFKSELEDLCLKETRNQVYKELSVQIAAKKSEREAYIQEVKEILEAELKKYSFKNAKVYGRPKHFYSIYRKMIDRKLQFEDIHDLFAFRIVVDSVKDCYEALGIVHSMWKPMPGRFKDYIAVPKANMYQSLHTTVIRPNGSTAEVQIRTKDMNKICEHGIAAHWAYKERNSGRGGPTDLKKFSWLRQMMELQDELQDPGEYLAAVKIDLFEEELFVFTPKGDVLQLVSGSTPVDFAFAVHTNIGLHTLGAKLNGRMVPLRTKLRSGDIVEILTSPNQKPNKDWLAFVVTARARNKIRSFLRSEQRQSSRKLGREMLRMELSKRQLDFEKLLQTGKADQLWKGTKESCLDEMLISIGYGRISAKEAVDRAYPEPLQTISQIEQSQPQNKEDKSSTIVSIASTSTKDKPTVFSEVLVSGLSNILVSFSKCCNPLPGESIIGFVTRGRGVTVHRKDCNKVLDLDPARSVEVSWTGEPIKDHRYFHKAFLRVITHDQPGILAEVTLAISSCGANISKAQVRLSEDLHGILDFEVALRDLKHLNLVVQKIESVSNIILVERHFAEQDKKESRKKR